MFVATDLTWGTQISALGEGELDEKTHKVLSISAFTTHILKSLVTAMTHRISTVEPNVSPFRRAEMGDTTEAFLVKHISELWRILPQIPSLRSLKQALSVRLSHIREIANAERLRSFETRHNRIADEKFLHLDFIESVGGAVECFNDLVQDDGGKWALLFDELELAPDWIRDNLILSLRSRNPHILLKLALSPFSPSYSPRNENRSLSLTRSRFRADCTMVR
ncbi:MAG: hypothetical protein IPJ30_11455 [Acidobacteria bacterium]|nr:hypothetical protein [Acidobacteriota bacterium]